MDHRSRLSVAATAVFAASLAATSKAPSGASDGADTGAATFGVVARAAAAAAPAGACTSALLESALTQVPVPESWEHVDKHQLLLLDLPVAQRFTRANAQKNNPSDGWAWVSSPLVKELNPESYSAFEHSDSKVSQRIGSFRQHPLFAILRAEERRLPKVTSSEDFAGGKLTGNLVVARVDTGAAICTIAVSAESSSNVKFKERGISGKSAEQALLDDFKSQVVSALRQAVKAVGPTFSIDVGS